ncbi:GNAT family N-acetyltransferase [Estrella lausannensis]|uniref:Putativenucleotidyltransferase/acetyltransferase n=1 Tax=Estrella lausannensis TaxID=483423 RepID=A0A0H5DNQ2_9BACT|nr:GNAT family N-acetyltransferase [Estrella lausannensis]CRX37902.1 Putativenucleotidyltransferase/acetyltransferase [Estrella lausannensis]
MLIAETARLTIRWFREDDRAAFKSLVQDPEVMRFSLKGPANDADVDVLFAKLRQDYQEHGFGLFALEEKSSKAVIGFAGIKQWEIDGEIHKELGYRLLPKYWGKGLAFEATRCISDWAFKTLDLNCLIALIEPENLRSIKLAKRLGMKRVKSSLFLGVYTDIYLLTKKYAYKDYSRHFPNLFTQEKDRLLAVLPHKTLVEHVGSTAVPDLGGKGIIDLAVCCPIDDLKNAEKAIEDLGYAFNLSGSSGERRFFKAYLKDLRGPYNLYHLHLLPEGCPEWDELIDFRNYLRDHPAERALYASIKKQAALRYPEEGEKYREAKKPLIDRIKKEIRLGH